MALTHGGDSEGFALEYGYPPLDFSASCNPLGVPDGVRAAICAAAAGADRYPDPLCRRLRHAIAEHEGVLTGQVLCGNGAADLIYRLVLAVKPKQALVTAPAFAEYELALRAADCEVLRHPLRPEDGFSVDARIFSRIRPGLDLLFLCNPNNPTGTTAEPALLRRLSDLCEKNGTLLVVDECFIGFLDEPEVHTLRQDLSGRRSLLLLDAFTKLYGMAGVRLGFCLSDSRALLEAMERAGQPWAVSSLAQAAGLAALTEDHYVARSRALIRAEKAFLAEQLRGLGVHVLGGEANFLFFHADVPDLAHRLRRAGILIRDCGNFLGLSSGYFRIAVRTHGENEALIRALARLAREDGILFQTSGDGFYG